MLNVVFIIFEPAVCFCKKTNMRGVKTGYFPNFFHISQEKSSGYQPYSGSFIALKSKNPACLRDCLREVPSGFEPLYELLQSSA